jgi:hypothetical protein
MKVKKNQQCYIFMNGRSIIYQLISSASLLDHRSNVCLEDLRAKSRVQRQKNSVAKR